MSAPQPARTKKIVRGRSERELGGLEEVQSLLQARQLLLTSRRAFLPRHPRLDTKRLELLQLLHRGFVKVGLFAKVRLGILDVEFCLGLRRLLITLQIAFVAHIRL